MATIEEGLNRRIGDELVHRGRTYQVLRYTTTSGADERGEYLKIPVSTKPEEGKPSREVWITLREG